MFPSFCQTETQEELRKRKETDLVVLSEGGKIGKGLGHGEVFQIRSEGVAVGNGFAIESRSDEGERIGEDKDVAPTDALKRQEEHCILVQEQQCNRQEDHSKCLTNRNSAAENGGENSTFSSNGEKNWSFPIPILGVHIVALSKSIGRVAEVIDFGIKNQWFRRLEKMRGMS